MNAIEVTINIKYKKDDKEEGVIETKATINWDHVRAVIPRSEGGSQITWADGSSTIVGETRADINQQVVAGGLASKPLLRSDEPVRGDA